MVPKGCQIASVTTHNFTLAGLFIDLVYYCYVDTEGSVLTAEVETP